MKRQRILSMILIVAMLIMTSSPSVLAKDSEGEIFDNKAEMKLTSKLSGELSESELKKVEEQYTILSNHIKFLEESVVSINVGHNGIYVFDILVDGIIEQVSLFQNSKEKTVILFQNEKLSNKIEFYKDGRMILDGNEVKISFEENDGEIVPKASTTWWAKSAPYGKAGDYTVSAGTASNANVDLGKAINSITVSAFYTLLTPVIGGAAAFIYSSLYSVITSQDPRTTGLSYKAKLYYHKNQRSAGYIPAANLYATKYNYTWYSKKNYKGTTTKEVVYLCKRLG